MAITDPVMSDGFKVDVNSSRVDAFTNLYINMKLHFGG